MLITIVLIPVLAALVALALPKKHAAWPVLFGNAVSFLIAGFVLFSVLNDQALLTQIAGLPGLPYLLEATHFSAVILLAVNTVSLFIFIYARGYMHAEPNKKAFWSGMGLFLAAMELLVLSGDWVSFIIGWEIMGFASYRLIATWHHKKEAQRGANQAFIITRITDMGLYLGVFLIILETGSSGITDTTQPVSVFAGFALLFAVMGKSAQVPFQSWLSGAMAGPTPVSSFLHSATLVAAGIILMLKSFPLFPETILPWIGLVGGVTILFAGITAVFSADVKQMLAASTSSHLGLMLLAIGAGYPGAATAHLLAHAFMKSTLFLGAGIWQHTYDSTAFDKIKSAGKDTRYTYLLFALSAVALAGIPPLVGYYSKDAILAAGLKADAATWYFLSATLGALLTALYMGRALQLLWSGGRGQLKRVQLKNWMRTGMALLSLVVIAGGFLLKPSVKFMKMEMPHSTAAIFTGIVAALTGLAAGWFLISKGNKSKAAAFIRNNYPLAGGYQLLIVEPVMKLAQYITRGEKGINTLVESVGILFYRISSGVLKTDFLFEQGIKALGNFHLLLGNLTRLSDESGLEEAINELIRTIKKLGKQSQKLQNGLIHREMMWSVVGFISFILILIFIN